MNLSETYILNSTFILKNDCIFLIFKKYNFNWIFQLIKEFSIKRNFFLLKNLMLESLSSIPLVLKGRGQLRRFWRSQLINTYISLSHPPPSLRSNSTVNVCINQLQQTIMYTMKLNEQMKYKLSWDLIQVPSNKLLKNILCRQMK